MNKRRRMRKVKKDYIKVLMISMSAYKAIEDRVLVTRSYRIGN
jgi:hypothetical protein